MEEENVLAKAAQAGKSSEGSVGLLYGTQGNVTGILGVIRDETARFAADRNLRTRLAELEQRERINATEASTRKII